MLRDPGRRSDGRTVATGRLSRTRHRRTGHSDTESPPRGTAPVRVLPGGGGPSRSSTSPSSRASTANSSTTSPRCASSPKAGRSSSSASPDAARGHLATALAILAVEAGYRGYLTSADDMVAHTSDYALVEGTFNAKLKSYVAPSVLVIDDVGLPPERDGPRPPCSSRREPAATRSATRRSSRPTVGLPEVG